mmetsp:Transcript_24526/g.65181  ORF Transcript_24526/g.65181 Transcript_24526/m.65181 type:complete len:203 (+) Transcript_24526:495-1103(+)
MHPNAPGSQVIGWITCRLLCASLHENRVEVHQCEVLDRDEPTQTCHPEADAGRSACQVHGPQQSREKSGNLVNRLQHEAMPREEDPGAEVRLRVVDVLRGVRRQQRGLQDEGGDRENREGRAEREDRRGDGGGGLAEAARRPAEGRGEGAEEGGEGEVPGGEEGHAEGTSDIDAPSVRELLFRVVVSPGLFVLNPRQLLWPR